MVIRRKKGSSRKEETPSIANPLVNFEKTLKREIKSYKAPTSGEAISQLNALFKTPSSRASAHAVMN